MRAQSSFQGTTRSISARNFSRLVGFLYFSNVEAFASVFWRFINPHLPVWSGVRNNSIALFYKVEGQFAEDFFRDSLKDQKTAHIA
jgi:hypothetical protein